jgi:hypothetical protein
MARWRGPLEPIPRRLIRRAATPGATRAERRLFHELSHKYGGTSSLQADEGGIVRSVWDIRIPIIGADRRSGNFVFPNSDYSGRKYRAGAGSATKQLRPRRANGLLHFARLSGASRTHRTMPDRCEHRQATVDVGKKRR